jgi:flagellar hook-length control protein FliK
VLEIVRQGVFRPFTAASTDGTPAGGAASGGAPVQAIQTVQPAAASVKLTPENLVADVREAVMRLAADGSGAARIVLHPPELGELVVRLESSRNGVVRAEFHTVSPLVREALEAGLDRLTDALKSEGLTLAQAQVYLDLHLGPEGRSGESEQGTTDGTLFPNDQEDALKTGIPDGAVPDFERLPEGATISILA